MKKFSALLLLCFVALIAIAQNQKETVEFKLRLRDGNVISGNSASISKVDLVTPYGKLEIPIKNVTSIVFGVNPDVANKLKIINLVKQMNDPSEDKRVSAFNELIKMPVGTIPVLSDYLTSDEYVQTEYSDYTAESALNELKNVFNIDDYNEQDVVVIDNEYSIGGTYNFKNINLKTEYGVLDIPKYKIKEIEVTYIDSDNGDRSFKLIASKHISGNDKGGWLNTGIKVKAGQKINIIASGQITLESLSGNVYTPDGNKSNDYESEGISAGNYPSYGNLIYKIGEFGSIEKAGSNYNSIVKESGILYLSIYETVYNSSNTGFYSVKISIK